MTRWDGSIPCHPYDAARLVYVELPKAGCTSIKTALSPLRGGPPEPDEDVHRWTSYTWARDLGELHRWLATRWSTYFRFTVTRDPVTRFESWYYDKLSPLERWTTSIDEYVAWDFARDDRRLDVHAVPQTMIIGTELWRYDLVGRLEDLAGVVDVLARDAGVPVSIPRLNAATEPRPPLARGTADRLRALYATDVDVLGYAP